MQDAHVTELLTGAGEAFIPDLKRQSWLNKVENDSVALFLEECVITTSASDYTLLGGKGGDSQTLYGAYLAFCEENNSKSPFTRQNFRGHFIDLCREIGWNEVEAKRKETGWRIYGVRLRGNGEVAEYVSDLIADCRPCRPAVDASVNLEPLPHRQTVDPVDVTALLSRKEQKENPVSPPPLAAIPPELITEHPALSDAIPPAPVYRSTEPLLEADSESTGGVAAGLQGLQDSSQVEAPPSPENHSAPEPSPLPDGHCEPSPLPSPASSAPWTPRVGQPAFYGDEQILVVGFTDRGRQIQIEYPSGKTHYVKRGCLSPDRTTPR